MRAYLPCLILFTATLLGGTTMCGCQGIRIAADLPDAELMESYDATIHVVGAVGAVQVDLLDGSLPDGLVLESDGRIHGEPLGAGSYDLTVRVVDRQQRWAAGTLSLVVSYGDEEVYLGPVMDMDEMNRLCLEGTEFGDEIYHLMCQPWIRIEGAGVPDQSARQLTAGLFWVGPNGFAEGGWFDDVLLRELPAAELDWSFEPGSYLPEFEAAGPNSPIHTTVNDQGLLVAGEETGPGVVVIEHVTYGLGSMDILVVPPDFCPAPNGC